MLTEIRHKATPQQPSEPLKELDEQDIIDCIDLLTKFHNIHFVNIVGKEWNFSYWFKVTLAKEIYKKFGHPSEKKALSVDSIKALLTTIMKKELVDIGEHFCFVCGEPMSEEKRGLLINHIAQAIHSALPTQKALSVEEIEKVLTAASSNNGFNYSTHGIKTLAQAIESALPARKEVKWPEKYEGRDAECEEGKIFNYAVDLCIAAYEEAIPAHQYIEYLKSENESLRKFPPCGTDQREVRYPEKMDHDHSCEFDCKGCVDSGWNQAIDEFKKLNS